MNNELESLKEFWASNARELFWHKKYDSILNYDLKEGKVSWFEDGKINACFNALDVHLPKMANKAAIIFEPNNINERSRIITYAELHTEVCKFANLLVSHGVKKGDRVCIYMPMIPEAVVAMLAASRIGAVHLVVFAGFSANALAERINDAGAEVIITADWLYRGEKEVNLFEIANNASLECKTLNKAIVFKRRSEELKSLMQVVVWQEEIDKFSSEHEVLAMASNDPLFILYTSGSTGKPKGIVHSTGGYLTSVKYSSKNVFGLESDDIFFCTADVGWITGHSYLVYGTFLNGITTVMFEGVPTFPTPSRYWEIVEKYNVNIFYTSPTAIRILMQKGEDFVRKFQMKSLRVLGTVGEPINVEAWNWYHMEVGKGRCQIMDTWWQTETGSILISSMAGKTYSKANFAGRELPYIFPVLLDSKGREITENDRVGNLCFKYSWPSMCIGIWGDNNKFKQAYFTKFPGYYFSGDGALKNKEGLYKITGRVDDVINISGHRFSSTEIENIVNRHKKIVESAVISFPHEIKGEAIAVFGILYDKEDADSAIANEVMLLIEESIGKIARPDKIFLVEDLPKTRSGKIMRRILKKMIVGDEDYGDISTLVNPKIIDTLNKTCQQEAI